MSSKKRARHEKAPSVAAPGASEVHQTTTKGDSMNSNTAIESSQLPVIAGHEIPMDEHGV